MNVLQVTKYYPPVMGGIESVAWELTEGLNRSGVRTDVLCSDQRLSGRCERTPLGYTVQRVGSLGTVLSTSMAPGMVRHLRELSRQRDVVHLHMPDPMTAMALYWVRPQARLVVHWHSDVVRQRHAMRVYEPLQRWILRRADAIIATSAAYAAHSQALQPWMEKVRVVPIGIGDQRSSAHAEKAAALRRRYGDRRLIFALGRMTYYKGFDVLIDAARSLPSDCAVVIGGDGERLRLLRQQVSDSGLNGRVFLPGPIRDDELASYFEACDVFCLSSTQRSEAYGVAIVEAMALGKPVVATDISGSGVPWVNQHRVTGLNVPPCQPQALARALGELLADEALRLRLGAAARQRYEALFTAERMTQQVLQIYRGLA